MDKKQKAGKHIYIVGIGGAGMSAIARVLLDRGFAVSGSDIELTRRTADLYAAGANIYKGHKGSRIGEAQMVVVSSAIPDDNPEVLAAKEKGIPVLKRGELLGSLMNKNIGIAIAGTHGKTTTTGMVSQILFDADEDPTVIMGGTLPSIGSNGRAGHGKHFIVEADEYDRMFLGLRPKVSIVTNVEYDHPDIYPTSDDYMQTFTEFVDVLPDNGHLIICAEDPNAVSLLKVKPGLKKTAYGIGFPITPTPGLTLLLASDLKTNDIGGTDFLVEKDLEPLGRISLRVPGEHNVNNALAAIAATLDDVDFDTIAQSLNSFSGVHRRFEIRGQVQGTVVVDDYAHHPTEIRTTLAAARQRYPEHHIRAVWQPHTYSRIRVMMSDFATCFKDADDVIVLDIYRSREDDTLGLDSRAIAKAIQHDHVEHIGSLSEASDYVLNKLGMKDVVITMNAGDAHVISDWILDGLREQAATTFVDESDTEDIVANEPEKKEASGTEDHPVAKLDATLSQVQRLVAKLQQEEAQKKSAGESDQSNEKKDS